MILRQNRLFYKELDSLNMRKQKIHHSALCLFAVLSLSACEHFQAKNILLKDNDLSSGSVDEAELNLNEESVVTSPSFSQGPSKGVSIGRPGAVPNTQTGLAGEASSTSVEIFDLELNRDYRRGVNSSAGQSPRQQSRSSGGLIYGEAFNTADSSVTIYGLDGDVPPHIGASPYGNNNYGANGFGSPSVSASALTQSGGGNQIFFKHGSSRLGSGDMRKISQFAETAKFAPVDYVTVAGFASKPTHAGSNSTQAHIINLRQSMKRSEKVSKALMRKGVPGEKIKTVSWGSSKATGNNSHDRRVDMIVGER